MAKNTFLKARVKGEILKEKKGIGGFGYDPIFKPIGYKETFAQMSIGLKNKISHRGLSGKKISCFFKSITLGL